MKAPRSRQEATSGRFRCRRRWLRGRSAPRGKSGAGPREERAGSRRRERRRARRSRALRASAARSTGSRSAASTMAQSSSRPPTLWGATTAGQASAASARSSGGRGGGGVVEGEDEDGRLVPDSEGLEAASQLGGVKPAAERARQHVAGESALRFPGDAAAHQLQGDDGDRLLQDQPLEVPQPAAVADDDDPCLGRPPARRDDRMGKGAAGDRRVARNERVAVAAVGDGLSADRADSVGRQLAAEAAAGDPLAAAVENRDGAADRAGDGPGDLLQPALLQNQPLESPLHGDPALQHLVLLVYEASERFLGDRDERGRVGDLEEGEVAFLRLLDQRSGQSGVAEPGAEAEAGEIALDELADVLALLGGGVQRDAGGQHQLPAGEPRGRVLELGDVDPAHGRLGRLRPGREVEVKLVEEALDREHRGLYLRTLSEARERTSWRTSWISSNCSVSAISGGASWTTGSPRSSARQIRPRL